MNRPTILLMANTINLAAGSTVVPTIANDTDMHSTCRKQLCALAGAPYPQVTGWHSLTRMQLLNIANAINIVSAGTIVTANLKSDGDLETACLKAMKNLSGGSTLAPGVTSLAI